MDGRIANQSIIRGCEFTKTKGGAIVLRMVKSLRTCSNNGVDALTRDSSRTNSTNEVLLYDDSGKFLIVGRR